jgi:hypothetical protein
MEAVRIDVGFEVDSVPGLQGAIALHIPKFFEQF